MENIKQPTKIQVVCKNKLTDEETTFTVVAYDFLQAKKILESEINSGWIIDWNLL